MGEAGPSPAAPGCEQDISISEQMRQRSDQVNLRRRPNRPPEQTAAESPVSAPRIETPLPTDVTQQMPTPEARVVEQRPEPAGGEAEEENEGSGPEK